MLSKHGQMLLAVFRGEAIRAQTRRTRLVAAVLRRFFGTPEPSALHLLAQRRGTGEHKVPRGFWTSCPRVTSKSGWITFSASASPASRVALQIAAAKLGIIIMTELEPHLSSPRQ